MHAPSNSIIPWAKRLGFVATVLAAGGAMQFGWAMGSGSWGKGLVLAGFCIIATAIVGYALIFAHRAYSERRWGIMAAAVVLWTAAVAVELLGAFGFNAAARSVGIEEAQHTRTTNTDTRAELDRARADLAAMKPGRTPATISADLTNIETRSWFTSTANCTNPGSYGNSCRRYQALKGELATAQARAALDKRVQDLTSQSANAGLGHSDVGAQSRIVASVANATMKPTAEQEYWSFVAVAGAFAFFMVLSSLLNFLAFAFDEEPETAKTAEIIPWSKPSVPVGTAHVGPTSGPMIPASLKVANG